MKRVNLAPEGVKARAARARWRRVAAAGLVVSAVVSAGWMGAARGHVGRLVEANDRLRLELDTARLERASAEALTARCERAERVIAAVEGERGSAPAYAAVSVMAGLAPESVWFDALVVRRSGGDRGVLTVRVDGTAGSGATLAGYIGRLSGDRFLTNVRTGALAAAERAEGEPRRFSFEMELGAPAPALASAGGER